MPIALLEGTTVIDLAPALTVSPRMASAKVVNTFRVTINVVRTVNQDNGEIRFWVDTRDHVGALTSSTEFPTESEALRYAWKLGA